MRGALVSDMTHLLDENGILPPRPRPIAQFLGAIVVAICAQAPGEMIALPVSCRRRPGHRPCVGEIRALQVEPSGEIRWHCPACGDHGYIRNWQGTPWDRRTPGESMPPSSTAGTAHSSAAARTWERIPSDARLRLLNSVWCPECRTLTSIVMSGMNKIGSGLVIQGTCIRCGDRVARVVEEDLES
jgi:hypothetical protein